MREHTRWLLRLTPLGSSHLDLLEHLGDDAPGEHFERYQEAFRRFGRVKTVEFALAVLLYAGFIGSAAATVGLSEAYLLEKVASYIGVSILLVLYGAARHVAGIYRENYRLRREILLAGME